MSLRDQVTRLFRKPTPAVRDQINKAAQTPDQRIAANEKAAQQQALEAARQAREAEDRQAALEKAGLQHAAPHLTMDGGAGNAPLRADQLEAKADRLFAAKQHREQQIMEARQEADKSVQTKNAQERPPHDPTTGEEVTPDYIATVEQLTAAIDAASAQEAEPASSFADERAERIAARIAEIEAEQASRGHNSGHDNDPGRTM